MSASPIPVLLYDHGRLTVWLPPSAASKGRVARILELEGTFPEAVSRLKAEAGSVSDVDVVLPTRNALVVALRLPTRDRTEVESMVELQAEEFSPYPIERTSRGWEIVGDHETGVRVRLVLASLNTLQDLRKEAEAAGLRIRRVDLEILGCLHLLAQAVDLPETGTGLLVRDGVADLVVWSDGQLDRLQHLGDLTDADPEEVAEEVSLVTLGLEPGATSGEVTVWVQGVMPAWAGESVPGGALRVVPIEADLNPVVGVQERLQQPDGLDLAPPQWEAAHQAVLRRKSLLTRVAGAAVLWLGLILGMVLWGSWQEREVRALESRVENRNGIVAEVEELGAQVRSMSSFVDRSGSALQIMRDFSNAVPGTGGDLEVTELRFDKERGVSFSGEARGTEGRFLEFIEGLSGSEVFEVEDYSLKEDRRGARSFQVTTRWRWDASMRDER